MAKKFLTPIQPVVLDTDPSGFEGLLYYNSSTKTMRFHNGTDWSDVGAVTSLIQHTHSANGDRLIDTIPYPFIYTADNLEVYDGGGASTTVFQETINGGSAS
jgi:hypothetical protein